jgi:hypothetical protein
MKKISGAHHWPFHNFLSVPFVRHSGRSLREGNKKFVFYYVNSKVARKFRNLLRIYRTKSIS